MDRPSPIRVSHTVVSSPPVLDLAGPYSPASEVIGAMALSVVTSLTVVHQLSERLAVAIDTELSGDVDLAGDQVIAGLEQALEAIRLVLGAIEAANVAVQDLHGHAHVARVGSAGRAISTSDGHRPADRR